MMKSLALILQPVSLKLLEISGIDCYVVRRIPENLTRIDDFSNFPGLLLWVYVKFFLIYSLTLDESFFRQLWSAASLKKE